MVTVDVRNCIESLAPEWERLAHQTKASPFLWPGWVDAWWRAFGAGTLHMIAVHENGRLTGVAPLRQSLGALSLIPNTVTSLSGFLAADETAAKHLSRALFSQKPRRVDLTYVSPADIGTISALEVARAAGHRVRRESNPLAEQVPYVAINETWDTYESGLRRKFRSELRRRRRRLEEKGTLTLEIFTGMEELDERLEEGFRVEGAGWKGAYGTSINSRPKLRRFYTDVAHWAAERDWLRLAFLRLDGRAIAFDYCLEFNEIHYLLKTGYDPFYRKFAAGMVLRHLMLARAFSNGTVTYDFCGEDWGWKREWTSTVQERSFLHISAPTVLAYLEGAILADGSKASQRAKVFVRSALGERGYHWLKRARGLARAGLKR